MEQLKNVSPVKPLSVNVTKCSVCGVVTVFTGKANCPYYAKAELVADYLQANLPDFRVHKITQHPDKWEVRECKSSHW